MLETLSDAFKEDFTEESRAAWNKIIVAIAKFMLKGISKAKENKTSQGNDNGDVPTYAVGDNHHMEQIEEKD